MALTQEQQEWLREERRKDKDKIEQRIWLSNERRKDAEAERQEKLRQMQPVITTFKGSMGVMEQIYRRPFQIWQQEAKSGLQTIGEAFKNRSILSGLGGLAQYSFSPLTGFARAWGGEPARDISREMGAPPWLQQMVGVGMEEAALLFAPEYVFKEMKHLPTAVREFEKWKKLKPIAEGLPKKPERFSPVLRKILGLPETAEIGFAEWSQVQEGRRIQNIKDALESGMVKYTRPGEKIEHFLPRLQPGVVDDITEAFVQAGKGNFVEGKRIFKQIRDALGLREIQIEELPRILKANNLSAEQFALLYADDISAAGRVLSYHSRAIRRLKNVFKGEKKALAMLETAVKHERGGGFADRLFQLWSRIDNPRRAILVSQLATAMRNNWSQAGRFTIGTFDDVLQAYLKTGSSKQAMKQATNNMWAVINQLRPAKRKELIKLLETDEAALQAGRLLSQPVHEVTVGGKVSKMIMWMNRAQEHFYRKLSFEAKFKTLLKEHGFGSMEKLDPSKFTGDRLKTFDSILEQSVRHGLEMTFAKNPDSKMWQQIVKIWSMTPATTVQPFPRFHFGNAVPFMLDHSPIGFLRAFTPETLHKLASGDPSKFAKTASRAIIGTLMLESAIHIRQSEYAGPRWYLTWTGKYDKKGDKIYMDWRAYTPLTTYLFIGELFSNPRSIKSSDWAQAVIGLNRISGSGLAFIDLFRTERPETMKKILINTLGEFVGSFSVTARMAKDIGAGVEAFARDIEFSDEAIVRDKRQNPAIAPFLDNIPHISRLLAEAKSPTRATRIRRLSPLLRQITGVTLSTKNRVEEELGRLGVDWSMVSPRTGDPEANNEIKGYMGQIVERTHDKILDSPTYDKASDIKKILMLSAYFKEVKRHAKFKLATERPELAAATQLEGALSNIEKDYLEEVWGMPYKDIKRLIKLRMKIKEKK
jgi:hypothetical protein